VGVLPDAETQWRRPPARRQRWLRRYRVVQAPSAAAIQNDDPAVAVMNRPGFVGGSNSW